MRRLSGFSLMEMMVVLLIVSIVAAASAPMISKKVVGSAENDSPWVWTGLNNNIAYNLDTSTSSAIIGYKHVPKDAEKAKLYIQTSDAIPQISLGDGTKSLKQLWKNSSIVMTTVEKADMNNVGSESVVIGNKALASNSGGGVAIGSESYAGATNSIALGRKVTANGIGIGADSNVTGWSVGIGGGTNVTGTNSIGIGTPSTVSTNNAIAIGKGSVVTTGNQAIAIGAESNSSKADAITLGYKSKASEVCAIAIGSQSTASGKPSIAIGQGSTASGADSILLGRQTTASGARGIAIGQNIVSTGTDSIMIGTQAFEATAGASNITAIGRKARACGGGVAVGREAMACSNGVALGTSSNTMNPDSVAIGNSANVSGFDAIGIGTQTKVTGGTAVALGAYTKATMYGVSVGPSSNTASGGTALGYSAKANGSNSTVVGRNSYCESSNSIAIGYKSYVSSNSANTVVLGNARASNAGKSVSIGEGVAATNSHTVAIGSLSTASGKDSVLVGRESSAGGSNSVAIGSAANASGTNAVAIGRKATAGDNQITLGNSNHEVYIPGNLTVDGTLNLGNVHIDRLTVGARSGYDVPSQSDWVMHVRGKAFIGAKSKTEEQIWTASRDGWGVIYRSSESGNDDLKISNSGCDRRLKNVGEKFQGGLAELKKLDLFHFTYKKDNEKTPHVGVMAQDLQKVFPNAVTKGEDGYLRIRWEDMFYALINAVKELDDKIIKLQKEEICTLKKDVATLKLQNAKLEKQNADLEKRLAALEKKVK